MEFPTPLAVKERPILFSAAMVRAILEGRKTQTRRIIKPQPDFLQVYNWKGKTIYDGEARQWCWMGMVLENIWDFVANRKPMIERCPYGQPGDRLWVREAWSGHYLFRDVPPSERDTLDYGEGNFFFKEEVWYWADGNPGGGDWEKPRPSIHMPRWASRITLEIVCVRVERLQDISEEDVDAEGFGGDYPTNVFPELFPGDAEAWSHFSMPECFGMLWESINGAGSWDTNPWVWVVEFKRVGA